MPCFSVLHTIPYTILINSTGSTSIQPIKAVPPPFNLQSVCSKFKFAQNDRSTSETASDADISFAISSLLAIFSRNDIPLLENSFSETFHVSIQSLLYLPTDHINLLINYYLPGMVGLTSIPVDSQHSSESKGLTLINDDNGPLQELSDIFSLLRSYVLTCFVLSTQPHELNRFLVQIPTLTQYLPIVHYISDHKITSKGYDSGVHRFVELAAVRSMLIYKPPTNSRRISHTNPPYQLPEIKIVNFVGAGATAVELFGSFLDLYYNKAAQSDAKASATSSPHSKVQFNMWSASPVLAGFPASVGDHAKQHFVRTYSHVAEVSYHENIFWNAQIARDQFNVLNDSCKHVVSESQDQQFEDSEVIDDPDDLRPPQAEIADLNVNDITAPKHTTTSESNHNIQTLIDLAENINANPLQSPHNDPHENNFSPPGSIISLFAFGIQRSPFASPTTPQLINQSSIDRMNEYLSQPNEDQTTSTTTPLTTKSPASAPPGLVFTIGDAYIYSGVAPNARVAHSHANYATDNTIIYLKHFFIPFIIAKTGNNQTVNDPDRNNLQQQFEITLNTSMWAYKPPTRGQATFCHLGRHGGFIASPNTNFLYWASLMGFIVPTMKTTMRGIVTSSLALGKSGNFWDCLEFISSYIDTVL